jgi:hypothetical protein
MFETHQWFEIMVQWTIHVHLSGKLEHGIMFATVTSENKISKIFEMGTNSTRISSKEINTAIVTAAVPLLCGYSIPGRCMGFPLHSIQTSSSDHPSFYPMDIRGSSLSGRGAKLTTHLSLVPICAAIPPLRHTCTWRGVHSSTGTCLYLHGLQFSDFFVLCLICAASSSCLTYPKTCHCVNTTATACCSAASMYATGSTMW